MALRKRKKQKRSADPRLAALQYISDGMDDEGIIPMSEVPDFKVIPSIFAGFNRAIGMRGVPLNTVVIVHGPQAGGKTLFTLGAGIMTFQQHGGIPWYVDAEHAADVRRWFKRCGIDLSLSWYKKPRTYEQVIKTLTLLLINIRKGIDSGGIDPDIGYTIILDSLDKAIPQSEIDYVLKHGKIDRNAGRWKAAMNKYFFNLITPLMMDLPVTLFVIAHESKSKDKYGRDLFDVKGGTHILYDARCQFRVKFIGFDKVTVGGNEICIRKKHLVKILKNKVGFPNTEFIFYSATQEGHERGQPWLDLGRELFQEAGRYDVFKKHKARFKFDGRALYLNQWVDRLNEDAGFYHEIWAQVAHEQDAEWAERQ